MWRDYSSGLRVLLAGPIDAIIGLLIAILGRLGQEAESLLLSSVEPPRRIIGPGCVGVGLFAVSGLMRPDVPVGARGSDNSASETAATLGDMPILSMSGAVWSRSWSWRTEEIQS